MATGGRSLADINAAYKIANPLSEELASNGPPRDSGLWRRYSSSGRGSGARFSDATPDVIGTRESHETPPPSTPRRSFGSYFSSFFGGKSSKNSSDSEVFTTPPERARRPPLGARRSSMTMDDLDSLRLDHSLPQIIELPPPPPSQFEISEASRARHSDWRSWIPSFRRGSLSGNSSTQESVITRPPPSGPTRRPTRRYPAAAYTVTNTTAPPVVPSSTAPPARPTPIGRYTPSTYTTNTSSYDARSSPVPPPLGTDGSVYTQSQLHSASLWGSIKSGLSGAYSYMTGGGASSAATPASPSGFGSAGVTSSAPPHRTSFDFNTDLDAGNGARLPPITSTQGSTGVSYYSRPPPAHHYHYSNSSQPSRPLSAPASQSSFGVYSRDPAVWTGQTAASSVAPVHFHQVSTTPGLHYHHTSQFTQPQSYNATQTSQPHHYHHSTQVTRPSRWGDLKSAFSGISSDQITGGQFTRWDDRGGAESHVYARDGDRITHTVDRWGQSGVTRSSVTYGSKW